MGRAVLVRAPHIESLLFAFCLRISASAYARRARLLISRRCKYM